MSLPIHSLWPIIIDFRVYNVNPYRSKLIYFNFHPLEVVFRYRDPQLQVSENYSYLFNFSTNIYKSHLDTYFIPNKHRLQMRVGHPEFNSTWCQDKAERQ